MNLQWKNKVVTAVLILFFAAMSLLCWLKPAETFSESERRMLELFPQVSVRNIISGNFMSKFGDYTTDQFPLRDELRTVKAVFASHVMNQRDNNGIYMMDGYVSKMEYPLKEDSVLRAAQRFNYVYDKYLAGTDAKAYVSIVPDKNYFMAKDSNHLAMDYEKLTKTLVGEMKFADYIDITGQLKLEDYYKTDTHWRQECITDVAVTLLDAMGSESSADYEEQVLTKPFRGVYYGQAALPLPAETITYLTSDLLDACTVYDYSAGKQMDMYDMEKGQDKDPYELFLSGSLSLITIENDHATTDKELILFRDSFGSSIAPLLVEGYQKITLVDIRYIHPNMLERFIQFHDQDILFLYSTLVLNNSETIR